MDSWRRDGSPSGWNVDPRPLSFVVHSLGLVAMIFVLIWTVGFRGGLAFSASNKNLIFNTFPPSLAYEIFPFLFLRFLNFSLLHRFHLLQVHPVLMLLSLIFLGGESILVYKTLPGTKARRKLVHLSVHFIALLVGIIGIYAAFKYHNESNIDNLYSLHSWFGIITIVLYGIQWLIGLVTFFFPGLSGPARAVILPWHVFLGLLAYGLALTTSQLGFLEKLTFLQSSKTIGRYSSEAIFVNVTALVVVLLGVFVFLAAVVPDYKEHDYTALE